MTKEDLGRVVTTRAVMDLRELNSDFNLFVNTCLAMYMEDKWGDMANEDKAMNDAAVKAGNERIMASYKFPENASWEAVSGFGTKEDKLWIITEWDRSVTTILFPGEY